MNTETTPYVPPFRKRIVKHPAVLYVMSVLIASYVRFVHLTSRVEYHFHPDSAPYRNGEKNVILAFWHGRLLMMPKLSPKKRIMNVMISSHADGEIIAQAMHRFGFSTLRGSSRRGGMEVALQAIKALRRGENVSITPDGPKGPRQIVQMGIVQIARKTGVPVIAMTFSGSRRRIYHSWDRFMIARPFGRLHYLVSAPYIVPAEATEADMETHRLAIETLMNEQLQEADRLGG